MKRLLYGLLIGIIGGMVACKQQPEKKPEYKTCGYNISDELPRYCPLLAVDGQCPKHGKR